MTGIPRNLIYLPAGKPMFTTSSPNRRRTRAIAAGMTLLELTIACAILLVLATTAVPLARVAVMRRKEEALRVALRQIRDAIDRYKDYADQGKIQVKAGTEGYPPDLQTLVTGVPLAGAGVAAGIPGAAPAGGVTGAGTGGQSTKHLHFLSKIPIDPMTGGTDWGLRSVQDDPDSTAWGGEDVFDVYTKSTGTAMNGTKYSDW
jgi:general secretion pathway protein G